MKLYHNFFIPFFILFLSIGNSQAQEEKGRFGIAVNSEFDGVIGEINIAPTGLFYLNKSQFEVGFCLYPFNWRYPRMLGGNLGYKYFPNGINNRFNLYFNVNLNYTNEFIDHQFIVNNYQSTYNYLVLTGGYGFQVKFLKKAYIGLNLNLGVNTNSVRNSVYQYFNRELFEQYELDGAVRVNIGYRF